MRGLVSFFLSLRVIMLIGSLGALMGSLVEERPAEDVLPRRTGGKP